MPINESAEVFGDHINLLGREESTQCRLSLLVEDLGLRIVESACRSADIVAQYGGEEIAVLFPSLGVGDAMSIADVTEEDWSFPNDQLEEESSSNEMMVTS